MLDFLPIIQQNIWRMYFHENEKSFLTSGLGLEALKRKGYNSRGSNSIKNVFEIIIYRALPFTKYT